VGTYNRGMCIICIDLARGALRTNEARRAFREMQDTLPPEHARQVEQQLAEAEQREQESKTP
jgi:hypothetical protein